MKSQPFATKWRVVFSLLVSSGFFALPAHAATCTSTDLASTNPTAYIATAPNLVTVLDASTNSTCTIAVGNTPTSAPKNLAVSPDATQLFVENDGEGSVSVVNLSTGGVTNISLTTSGVSSPMTANLAVSPDGNSLYVIVLPQSITPGATKPTLYVVDLTSSSHTVTTASSFNSSALAVQGAGLGIAFSPDGSTAYVATEGQTYLVATSNNSISSALAINGGTVVADPAHSPSNFAYVVDVASSANTVTEIPTALNPALHPVTACTLANSSAITPDGAFNYYTCPGNDFVQKIDTGTNTVSATVPLASSSGPHGVAITSDGTSAYVANNNGSVSVVSVSGNSATTPITGLTALAGLAFRPVQVDAVSPSSPSVPTGGTQQFTSAVHNAFSVAGGSPVWAVNGIVGGNATVGTVSATGLYTAPNAIPAGGTVTVSVTSSEIPTFSKIYPRTTTVTVTPSKLAFTAQPPASDTAGTALTVVKVSVEDANGNVVTTDISTITIAISRGGAFSSSSTTTAAATSGIATFSNLVPTAAGPSFTLSAIDGSLAPATSTTFAVTAGLPAKLVFTNLPVTVVAGVCSTGLTVQAQDELGNPSNVPSTETLAPLANPTSGASFFTDSGCTTAVTSANLTIASGSSNTTFYFKDTLAGSPTVTVTGAGAFAAILGNAATQTETVNPAGANKLAFGQQPTTTTAGNAISPTVTVQVEDQFGNVVTSDTSTVAITVSGGGTLTGGSATSVAASAGVASFSNLVPTTKGSFTLGASDGSLAGATSNSFTVSPAGASILVVSGYPSPATAGSSNSFTVTAKDPYGNVATGYTGTVHFTCTDAQAVVPTNYTFVGGDNGVHTFNLTLKTAASQSITATDTVTATITGTQSGITVGPAGASILVVSGYPSPATAGSSNSFTVTAKDPYGNMATEYTGTAHFTSTDAQAVVPMNYTFVGGDNGVHTFNLTLKTAASQSITVTDTVTATITGTQSGITVGPAGASILVVSGYPSPATAGSSNSFTVTVKDPYGNTATGYTGTAHFTSTDAQAVVPTNYTFVGGDNGVHTFNLTLKTAASQSITATDTVTATITGTLSGIAVNPAVAAKLVFTNAAFAGNSTLTAGVCSTMAFTVQAQDPFGNPSNVLANTTVNLSSNSTGTTAFSTVTVASAPCSPTTTTVIISAGQNTINFYYSDTKAATPTITASGTLTSATQQETVTFAAASKLVFVQQPTPTTVVQAIAPVTVQVQDQFGNAVTSDSSTVKIAVSGVAHSGEGAFTGDSIASEQASGGLATFVNLKPTRSATLILTATDGTLMAATSGSFAVTGDAASLTAGSFGTDPTTNPLNITGSSQGVTLDLFGPAPSDTITFTVSCAQPTLLNSATVFTGVTCVPSQSAPMTTMGSITGDTQIQITFNVFRSSSSPSARPSSPSVLGTGSKLTQETMFILLIATGLFALGNFLLIRTASRGARRGFAFLFLLCLSVGWMSACTQFSTTSAPPPPVSPALNGAGSAVVTIAPSGAGGGDNFQTKMVTVYFNVTKQ